MLKINSFEHLKEMLEKIKEGEFFLYEGVNKGKKQFKFIMYLEKKNEILNVFYSGEKSKKNLNLENIEYLEKKGLMKNIREGRIYIDI